MIWLSLLPNLHLLRRSAKPKTIIMESKFWTAVARHRFSFMSEGFLVNKPLTVKAKAAPGRSTSKRFAQNVFFR